jgi:3-phosphoshikimate 1-carboxyvinyltransferase
VRVPGSKSITNRALLLAGVASGESVLVDPLVADDTASMAAALRALGVQIAERWVGNELQSWVVQGLGGAPAGHEEVYCGMGATVGRFLVPMLAAGRGRFAVDAHAQLRRRPLGPVLAALRAQGAAIDGDAFPLVIGASGLSGGDVEVDASVSSQFLSGLLMAAPYARADTRLHFDTLVSKPYLDLTLDAMRAFGVEADVGADLISVARGGYRAAEFRIEPDVSTASYFLGSAAVTGTTVRLPNLDRRTTAQGDIELVEFLERMGAVVRDGDGLELTGPRQLHGIEADMGNSSDVFMTLACVAVFADSPTTITGIGHARVKESDRITACAENLRRLRIEVDEGPDYLRVHPGEPQGTWLPTYEDHRIAMAFSLIGTRDAVTLAEPSVVGKTCPEFFELWQTTGATVIMGEND